VWQFGNELPLYGDASLIATMNHYFNYVRNYTLQKWQRIVPVSCALVDYPASYNTLVEQMQVDVITTNAGYRGYDYSTLWSGDTSTNFAGLYALSCLVRL
jgi:hypothetical protein